MARDKSSVDSLKDASKWHARYSGHGQAKGAAGYRENSAGKSKKSRQYQFLSEPGQTAIINPQKNGFKKISLGVAWDMMKVPEANPFIRIFRKTKLQNVDLDIGCLYELQDGKRGVIQAFGEKFGDFRKPPYIKLSGDEREGDEPGDDEYILVNGKQWETIKRLLIYVYIYEGAPHWRSVKPRISVRVPGEKPMMVTPTVHKSELRVCSIASMENVRNGIKLTNHTEYFPGHAEMDRAFGFGIEWGDGEKNPQ